MKTGKETFTELGENYVVDIRHCDICKKKLGTDEFVEDISSIELELTGIESHNFNGERVIYSLKIGIDEWASVPEDDVHLCNDCVARLFKCCLRQHVKSEITKLDA